MQPKGYPRRTKAANEWEAARSKAASRVEQVRRKRQKDANSSSTLSGTLTKTEVL